MFPFDVLCPFIFWESSFCLLVYDIFSSFFINTLFYKISLEIASIVPSQYAALVFLQSHAKIHAVLHCDGNTSVPIIEAF